MDVAGNLSGGQLHHLGDGQLGQELGHFRTDHVRTQDLTVLRIGDQFDPTGVIAQTQGFTVSLEGELTDFDLQAAFLCLELQSDQMKPLEAGSRWHGASFHSLAGSFQPRQYSQRR